MTDFERKLNDLVQEALAVNREASSGATRLLAGETVKSVVLEVWSNGGETAFTIELSDGSILECGGVGRFTGPVADLVRMAGGNPEAE
jgi:hypothetical protein